MIKSQPQQQPQYMKSDAAGTSQHNCTTNPVSKPTIPNTTSDIILLNIQGADCSINSKGYWKLPFLTEQLNNDSVYAPIIALVESWYKTKHTDAQVHIPNYQTLRADRSDDRNRGGCVLYIHNKLPIRNVSIFDDKICQAIICTVVSTNTIVACIYRPPNTPIQSFSNMIKFLQSYIDKESNQQHRNILILGDFNLPYLRWINEPVPPQYQYQDLDSADILLSFMNTNFLSQYVDKPTRQQNILDLVLSNQPNLIKHIEVSETELSDHNLVTVKSTFGVKPPDHKKPPFQPHTYNNLNFFKAQFDEINHCIGNVNWDELYDLCTAEEFPELVRLTILQICELYTPTKCYRAKNLSKFKRERRTMNRKKRKLSLRLENKKLNEAVKSRTKKKLVDIMDQIKKSINDEHLKSEKEAINKIKTDPKYFFNYSSQQMNCKSGTGPLLQDGNLHFDDKSMADILQQQFCSVFSDPENPNKEYYDIEAEYEEPLTEVKITLADMTKALKEIKPNSSSTNDDMPAILLKKCSATINYPLLLLWSQSLNTSYVHPQYKQQIITPLHKKESRAVAENYRPICPTSHVSKTCERIVRDKIVAHLVKNNLLCKHQHGFRKGHSCLTQLLNHINQVIINFINNSDTDCIYLDYAKAFDRVDHDLLLHKLHCYGIRGPLLKWIKSFLTERHQSVSVNGTHSYKSEVKSGVPQGTVLGPILFLIYINDIDKCIKHSFISCFADDTRVCKCIAKSADVQFLQEDINSVIDWTTKNNMALHEKKFQYVNHNCGGSKLLEELPFTSELFQYTTPNGTSLKPVDAVRDLGIKITPTLSWSPHIMNIVDNANRMAAWILSVFSCRDSDVMMTLYKSLVRPRVEFCCPIWDPKKIGDIILLEQVQRHFTAHMKDVQHLNYHERLSTLKLMSLQRRRERYSILHLHKVINNTVTSDLNITTNYNPRRGLNVNIPPILKGTKTRFQTLRDDFFTVSAPQLFNSLPKCIRDEEKYETFKSKLTAYLLSIPDHPPISGESSRNSVLHYAGWVENI